MVLKVFYHCQISLFFPLCVVCEMFISNFKAPQWISLKSTFFYLSIYLQHNIYFQQSFYFSQVNLVIVCHLSKICLQSERKASFYLTQNFLFFISKTLDFLFRKMKIAVPEFQNYKKNNFQF